MFKPLADVATPDPLHLHLPLFSCERGLPRPRSLEALHAAISGTDVSPHAPPEIRAHFQTARNLLLYSWYVYAFMNAAELHAYGSVEFALRKRIGDRLGSRPSLRHLLKYAVDQGWLRDSGFRRGRERMEELERASGERSLLEEAGYRFEPIDTDPQFYTKILCDTVPALRNHLAHGHLGTFRSALNTLEFCAEIINQSFVAPLPNGNAAGDERAGYCA